MLGIHLVKIYIFDYVKVAEQTGVTCEGSDRSDLHTTATGAAAVGEDPEVTPKSRLPICSILSPRDTRNLKGEVPEIKGARRIEEDVFQEAAGDDHPRLIRTQRKGRPVKALRIPEVGGRTERRTSTVPTWDEDRRPREADL
ncbi:hypothetical protein NDU88_005402 [Pleurodeles waltl]|uniref:Uncharacterized protein n=1 Tax=Pleurodeles waltl TaxID=8319 RepID=A0AAV7LLD2_PLEWA|nr:hypothetical protein NDU88_005402 [Pleurodeles waltl]